MTALLKRLTATPASLARMVLALFIVLELLIVVAGPSAKAAKRELAEAAAKGDSVSHWEPIADLGIHNAALLNLVLLVVLALTTKWWTRPFIGVVDDDPLVRAAMPLWRRWLLPCVYVLGFASVYGMTSFANKSLWWDEMWAVKQCSLGTWKEDKKHGGELTFQPTTWKRCAFYYQKPTNHAPMSLAQKASLTVWHAFTGAAPQDFSELAARMPALLASGLAVFLLMRLCGIAQGTMLGALLLLVHPWHLRYGVEARAYAFIVPLCISGILATRRVIITRGRTVAPWVWLAINQALWIWTYPNAVLDVLVLFLMLGFFLWRGERFRADRITAMRRLIVAHACAAALWLQLFLPNLMQAAKWAGKEEQGHQLNVSILKDTLASLAFGMEWDAPSANEPESRALTGLVAEMHSEPAAAIAVVVMLGLSLLGLRWAMKQHPRTGWLLMSPVISSVLYAAIGAVFGIYFYPRFVIALLPIYIVGLSLSGWLFSVWEQVQRRIVLGVMVLFVFITNHQRGVYMALPYSGFKQAADLVKQHDSTKPPLILCYGLGREVISVYLRDALPAASASDVTAALAKATSEQRELLVIQGYTVFNRERAPDGMKLLDDRKQFEELGAFPGIEPDFFFRVLKAK
jgi:hypothetical protein